MKNYKPEEIERIVKANKRLAAENRALKKLVNSKRFKAAWKLATGYNVIFPVNTMRRKVVTGTAKKLNQAINLKKHRQEAKLKKRLKELSKSYQKIFVVNSILWDVALKQRPHHLAKAMCDRGFFVVYLEMDNAKDKLREIQPGLVTINNQNLLDDLVEDRKAWILISSTSGARLEEIEHLQERGFKMIYDYLDEFHEDISGGLDVQLEVWDNLKQLKPAMAIATAKKLYSDVAEHLGSEKNVLMAQNAVNVEHFNYQNHDNEHAPEDLATIVTSGKPIIGFYGALAPWIDFEMMNKLAKKRQDWNFVYIGIDYGGAAKDLAKGKNVYNLGPKDYADLAKYAGWFNCALIPFKTGEIAKATSPVKLFEYMAAGLPTVCTRDLEECRGYKHVHMSKDAAEFEKNIEKAIKEHKDENVRAELLEQAKEHTWAKRAEAIAKRLK